VFLWAPEPELGAYWEAWCRHEHLMIPRGREHFMRILAQYLALFSFGAPHGLVAVGSVQATVDETVLNTEPNPWSFDTFVNEGFPVDTPLTSDIAGSTLREAFCLLPSGYNDACDWCAANSLWSYGQHTCAHCIAKYSQTSCRVASSLWLLQRCLKCQHTTDI
jgi:hypothetical protein